MPCPQHPPAKARTPTPVGAEAAAAPDGVGRVARAARAGGRTSQVTHGTDFSDNVLNPKNKGYNNPLGADLGRVIITPFRVIITYYNVFGGLL